MREPAQRPALGELTRIQELVYELRIERVMARPVITVTPDTSLLELKEVLRMNRVSGVPVLEGNRMVGIISIEDLIRAFEEGTIDSKVARKMTRNVIAVCSKESVVRAVELFGRHQVGRLPVISPQGDLVGILTSSDITRGLLEAIGLDYHEKEADRHRANRVFEDIVSDETVLTLRYEVSPRNFACGGEASSRIKRTLLYLGCLPAVARRVAIAAYEAEMNLVIHTNNGGTLVAEICPDNIRILAEDDSPGIPDVELAMQAGYSTAPDWIRSLGFGAGMGLLNIQRCADYMDIHSEPGEGTRLEIVIDFHRD